MLYLLCLLCFFFFVPSLVVNPEGCDAVTPNVATTWSLLTRYLWSHSEVTSKSRLPLCLALHTSPVMPKAPRKKYYAVRVGREGPKIYDTWEEVGLGYPRLC